MITNNPILGPHERHYHFQNVFIKSFRKRWANISLGRGGERGVGFLRRRGCGSANDPMNERDWAREWAYSGVNTRHNVTQDPSSKKDPRAKLSVNKKARKQGCRPAEPSLLKNWSYISIRLLPQSARSDRMSIPIARPSAQSSPGVTLLSPSTPWLVTSESARGRSVTPLDIRLQEASPQGWRISWHRGNTTSAARRDVSLMALCYANPAHLV